MPHDANAWLSFLPAVDCEYDRVAGTPVTIWPAADGQIVLTLRDGPALFVSFDSDEDPHAAGTFAEITLDWTGVTGPPASGITPLVVAWTAGGGVLQLAPEHPDPGEVAPGMRLLGGPEFVLAVPPRQLRYWIHQLLAMPRRSVLDRRMEQVLWLGAVDPNGWPSLQRICHGDRSIEVHLVGSVHPDLLAPVSALAGLDPRTRARWAGSTRVYAGAGHLTAELFAVESERGVDGIERAGERLHEALRRLGWSREDGGGRTTWRQSDGPSRWWVALHPTRASCPIPLQVPELDGAARWVERGEFLAVEPVQPVPASRQQRRWRRSLGSK